MTTAMDAHFEGHSEPDEMDGEYQESVAPPKKKLDLSAILILGVALAALGGGGYFLYQRNFASANPAVSDAAGFEPVQVAPTLAPMPVADAVVTNEAPASAVVSQLDQASAAAAAATATATATASASSNSTTAALIAPGAPQAPQSPVNPTVVNTASPASTMVASPLVPPAPIPAQARVVPPAPAASTALETSLAARLVDAQRQLAELQNEKVTMAADLRAAKAALSRAQTQKVSQPRAIVETPFETEPVSNRKAAKPVVAAASKAQPSMKLKPTESVLAAPSHRSDFRIYAMRDGQAWIQDLKSKETIPAVVGSMLPDGSRITKMDEASGSVYTSAGEIRYLPAK